MIKEFIDILIENPILNNYNAFYLGGDVGGTYTRFGVSGIKESKPELIFTIKFETSSIDSVVYAINKTLSFAKEKFNIDINSACIGSAGVVSDNKNHVDLTNAKWSLDVNQIKQETSLKNVYLINDFQAIGYGINLLDETNNEELKAVRQKENKNFETKAVLGAGTGLGKCILYYSKKRNCYIPLASEGGNSDFPAYNNYELELVNYIKEIRNISKPLVYEELLSGRGIEGIYKFLKQKNEFSESIYSKEIEKNNNSAFAISEYKDKDETCKKTFELFSCFYSRCAKNFALDTLCKGGIYIAGGIALKNSEIINSKEFINEFDNGNRREDFLKGVPIYLIKDPLVAIKGACFAARIMERIQIEQ